MANDNNIKNFTATDIEKYHRGLLSPEEMHALEKAALDDPFLADALEGYAMAGIEMNADIAELKKRLAGKSEQAKVVTMQAGGRSSFPWLRAVAVVVLIAGAGLLGYLFLFNTTANEKEIAVVSQKAEKSTTTESSPYLMPETDSNDNATGPSVNIPAQNNKTAANSEIRQQKTVTRELADDKEPIKDPVKENSSNIATETATTSALAKTEENKKADTIVKKSQRNDAIASKGDIAAKDDSKSKELALEKTADSVAYGALAMKQNQTSPAGRRAANYGLNERYSQNTNIFRGIVTDDKNNALPFANITSTGDNVGTYSDARGNFTLVSSDTVLNVQVRSLGFENNNVQLWNHVPNNQVRMREDRSLSANVLDTVKRNANRARNSSMKFEEPEPADGWPYYDTYLANNLNVPDAVEIKKGGGIKEVQVSFEVNKDGEPVNIKIEKSLCDKCDKEAIRLIKEGPKWKRKAKKGRTTVTVPFPQ